MIGTRTIGTTSATSALSFTLVITSITAPPTSSSRLRRNCDRVEPTTIWRTVTSAVRRETISAVLVVS